MISVLILTRNEQRDLPDCLASVSWSDDIHVFDSHSTDNTVEIAKAAGAQVHTRTFDDYATHRNAAVMNDGPSAVHRDYGPAADNQVDVFFGLRSQR